MVFGYSDVLFFQKFPRQTGHFQGLLWASTRKSPGGNSHRHSQEASGNKRPFDLFGSGDSHGFWWFFEAVFFVNSPIFWQWNFTNSGIFSCCVWGNSLESEAPNFRLNVWREKEGNNQICVVFSNSSLEGLVLKESRTIFAYSGGNNRFLGRNATFQENTFCSQFGGISNVFGAGICQVSGNQKTLLQPWEHINALEKKIQLQSLRILVCENVTVPTKGAPFWWKSVKSRPWGPNPYDTIAAMKVEEPLWIFHQGIPQNYRNPADTSNCGLDDGLWFSCEKRQVGSMRQWLI